MGSASNTQRFAWWEVRCTNRIFHPETAMGRAAQREPRPPARTLPLDHRLRSHSPSACATTGPSRFAC